ncbi:MAG: lytic transglycosylase domain-containing protein [Actinomycetes bacterium]
MRRLFGALALVVLVLGAVAIYAVRTEPGWYIRARFPLHYQTIIEAHAVNYGLDPSLVAAVVYTESKFDPNAKSSAGAIGLMQLLPQTAQGIADRTGGGNFTPDDLYNPEINIRYGCWYLTKLRDKYAEHPQALELALAAYNAGQGNVDHWVATTPAGKPVRIRFRETRDYVRRVEELESLYQRGYGLR